MTLHQGTGGLRFSCQKRLSQWALAVDADRGQEATAANISCSSGEQFKEFSLPRSACSVLYYSWGGGGGAGEKRVACCTIENARFTCLLLPLWLAFSCGGNCIGTHAVEWGWRVYLSPAFAVSCCKNCIYFPFIRDATFLACAPAMSAQSAVIQRGLLPPGVRTSCSASN